ncbi:MAG: hypothetical protein J6V72_05425 [Kiritimatiellae bacterium]|nr:hypothetical protein [Kiritimatiellia bacterium]
MKKTLIVVALALCAGVWAEDTARVTVPGGTTTDYATLQAALNACTGGETVTMLADMTLNTQVKINADVTLDLDGHALVMTAYSDFLGFSSNLTATICGGGTVEVRTARSLITVKKGTTVNVTNCTLKGYCMFYGDNDTGKLNVMADTVALVDYPISSYSAAVLNVHAGHVASMRGWREGTGSFTSNIKITGGCFTRDPSFTEMLDESAYGVMGVSETQGGTTFTCKVVPKGEITNRARVTKNGTSTDYDSIQTALAACTGGETVTMLASEHCASYIQIKKSIVLDLATLTIRHLTSNSIRSDSGTIVTIQNGRVVGATSQSTFAPAQGSVMNVTNCTATGNCLVWSSGTGKLNILPDSFVNVKYLGSGNGNASLEVRGGHINYTSLRDKNAVGTTFQFLGGYFNKLSTDSLAEGYRYVFNGETTKDYIKFYYRVMSGEEIAAVGGLEAENGAVGYLKLQDALAQVKNNETVCMVKDVVASAREMTPVNRNFTFDLGGHCFSGGVDIFGVYTNSTVRLRNGTIRETTHYKSCFQMWPGATLIVESTVRIEGTSGNTTCCVYIPSDNAHVVFDGAQIATTALYSWGTAPQSTIEITGDSVMTCSSFQITGSAKLPPNVVATGGSFAVNPTSYVTNNHVVLYRANASPCKWQVKPWAAICADGWTFDLPMEAATVTGTCAAPSAGPITVSLADTIPTRKTLLADLSGLALNSGTYADLSFVKDAALPASIQVSYENGRLYAWEAKGTIIVFK